MEIVSEISCSVLSLLRPMRREEKVGRLFCYCVEKTVDQGHLLFNLLTREIVFLTEEEWQNRFENEYLKNNWFVVPEDSNDKEYADLVRWVLNSRQRPTKDITGYTIFTTTDCNARCFYCFQMGRSRVQMTEATACKVADYIADHCGGKEVKLAWFGGEPLFNKEVIDIICLGLRKRNIQYTSVAVSNGYLFDKETIQTAIENWNLKRVQISFDGTKDIYNKVKAYIYRDDNPYQTVMENIGHLLDAGIYVSIRLNMDVYNAENLLELTREIAEHFAERNRLTIYANHLFDGDMPLAQLHTQEEWELRDVAMIRLNEKISEYNLTSRGGIDKKPKVNHCMADSGRSVTILPNGEIGLCEHFSESEFIGHIDREGFDQAVVDSWKERVPEIPECAECFYYPQCMQLKKCASGSVCFEHLRRERRRKIERQMLNEYRMWKNRETAEQTDEDAVC